MKAVEVVYKNDCGVLFGTFKLVLRLLRFMAVDFMTFESGYLT